MTRRALSAVLCVAILPASCGDGAPVITAGGAEPVSDANFAQPLDECRGTPPDTQGAFQSLTLPGAWFRIDGLAVDRAATDGSALIDGSPTMVGGDAEAVSAWEESQDVPLPLVSRNARQTEMALGTGAEVYTKLGYEGGEAIISISTVALLDEEFAFVGECKFDMVTVAFRERFGERSSDVVRSIIGADSDETASLLELR